MTKVIVGFIGLNISPATRIITWSQSANAAICIATGSYMHETANMVGTTTEKNK